jgi:MoxR-like ATPase
VSERRRGSSRASSPRLQRLREMGSMPEPPPPTQSEKVEEIALRHVLRRNPIVLYGPPGTGKTRIAMRLASTLRERNLLGEERIVQFHRQYSYEDFIEGIRPVAGEAGTFELRPGAFRQFCTDVESAGREPAGSVVDLFVIDEINRADIGATFGEALYLLEDRENRTALTAHSASQFSIPVSVALVGTMNSADRSIAILDFALRRRFNFISVYPDYEELERWLMTLGFDVDGRFEPAMYVRFVQQLNANIRNEPILGKQMQLGQAMFVPSVDRGEPISLDAITDQLNTVVFPQIEAYAGFGDPALLRSLIGHEEVAEQVRIGAWVNEDACANLVNGLGQGP